MRLIVSDISRSVNGRRRATAFSPSPIGSGLSSDRQLSRVAFTMQSERTENRRGSTETRCWMSSISKDCESLA